MLIISLKTDQPTAEIGLYKDRKQLDHLSWLADRSLSSTIHQKIAAILESNDLALKDLDGILIYKGPGSFTGLRIGFSVANALAYALQVPVVAEGGGHNSWLKLGLRRLENGQNEQLALPNYGAEPHITKPRK